MDGTNRPLIEVLTPESDFFAKDPTLVRVYEIATRLLKEQQQQAEAENSNVTGVMIGDLEKEAGLGHSVVYRRLRTLIKQEFLIEKKGRGRIPDLFFLPGQYDPEKDTDGVIVLTDIELLNVIESKRQRLRDKLAALDVQSDKISEVIRIKSKLHVQLRKDIAKLDL